MSEKSNVHVFGGIDIRPKNTEIVKQKAIELIRLIDNNQFYELIEFKEDLINELKSMSLGCRQLSNEELEKIKSENFAD